MMHSRMYYATEAALPTARRRVDRATLDITSPCSTTRRPAHPYKVEAGGRPIPRTEDNDAIMATAGLT